MGYKKNKDLLDDTKGADEGFDASGRSFLYHHVIGRGSQVKIPPEDLERYDDNIRAHLAAINRGRTEPITLRYFQCLAALYTEIVLDRYFNRRAQLLGDMNAFVRERNTAKAPVPPGLKESEGQFVRDLKAYWAAEKDKSLAGKEVFLLRNLSRGSGVGFFEESGFYPDFILWVVDGKSQRIIFIEPHGMLHAKAYIHDEKARLHERLPELAKEMGQRSKKKNIMLDSFIISATPYDDLYQRYEDGKWDRAKFAEKHILFPEQGKDYDYLQILFMALNRSL